MKKIWVVEMYDDGEWQPTIGAGLTRETARTEMRCEKFWNPDDKFRVHPYFSMEKERK